MTTGKWMPKNGHRNEPMIAKMRALWRQVLRKRPGEVTLKHVRSHTVLPGNDLADWLADQGTGNSGDTDIDTAKAEAWLAGWITGKISERAKWMEAGGGGSTPPNTLGDRTGVG